MTTLTTTEAAELVGVSPFTIRSWVARGYLAPIRANAHPVRFREDDVVECRYDRMPQSEHDALDQLWSRILAEG